MLETSNRRQEFKNMENLNEKDSAMNVKEQIELWEKNQWVIYFRHGYCQKITASSKADAVKQYNAIKDYAKILWHNGKVVEKFGGNPWTLNCI
jgi:hypothetical protein